MNLKKKLVSLHFYPVKGCKAIDLNFASVGPMGPEMDRRWMIVDANGRFISQRQESLMALIGTEWKENVLTIRIPKEPPLYISLSNLGPRRQVSIWDDVCEAIDQGDAIAERLSHFLHRECRLVFIPDDSKRRVNPKYAPSPESIVGFADRFPFLLISEASLQDLNKRLEHPILMNRFRPNLVVSGCEAYEEDTWRRIRIGNVIFKAAKPCSRCIVTTIDQTTGQRGEEPLKTLAAYRKMEKGILFGQNLVHENHGVLSVGERVEILE